MNREEKKFWREKLKNKKLSQMTEEEKIIFYDLKADDDRAKSRQLKANKARHEEKEKQEAEMKELKALKAWARGTAVTMDQGRSTTIYDWFKRS